ncbi:HNH endonuclease [Agromyces sp. Leaf222]|uniref:HNH endonuclease n=1 Tax=Agromyces sp. Leaf222 TaxID=1735688 RepID=UPI0006F2CC2F|nr:HNH endonuclease [Agromyces sp. Leaf222]KQM82337.1 hypothetical protein ASE68_02775 [Agromyces sp. Leaf222]
MTLLGADRARADHARAPATRAANADGGGAARAARPPALMRLQASAGNAAVAAMLAARSPATRAESEVPAARPEASVQAETPGQVQRLVRGAIPPPPVPPPTPNPAAHPGLRLANGSIRSATRRVAQHPSPTTKAVEAQHAAQPPAGDREAQAKAAKADALGAVPAGGFDKAAFVAAVKAAIDKQTPKTLEDADEFGKSGKADQVGTEVRGIAGRNAQTAARPMNEASARPPDPSRAVEKEVTPIPTEAPPGPTKIDAAQAAPSRAPPEQTDLRNGPAETDQKMADAGVTEDQLRRSNEPEFTGALAAKSQAEAHSLSAPAQLRAQEAQQLGQAQQGAASAGTAASAGLMGAGAASRSGVARGQQAARTKDEQERAAVTANVTRLFDETKTAVDGILNGIDAKVDLAFKDGEGAAKKAFTEQHTREMKAFRDKRYSYDTIGAMRWAADLLLGPEPEVDEIFKRARATYEREMSKAIDRIADLVGGELNAAKTKIAEGKAKIDAYTKSLKPSLQKVGTDAAKEVGGRFAELEASVDEKGQALAEDLATKYVEARTAVDDEIKAMQEANKGLVDKAKDAVVGAVETILKLKTMLLGVLARAAGAVEKIIKDPIAFLGNLVNAVKSGVMAFGTNIATHLKNGLQTWLFGALSAAGIDLPAKFDLQGILKLVLSILGLTWANVRARIAAKLPPGAIELVEQGFDVVKLIVKEGLGGIWRMILEKVGDIKEMIMGQVKEMVAVEIIKAGIVWLVSMLNPASAFVKACKMIYDVVMFFVEKAEQIKAFVDSILDSVESIASGGVGAVAGYIENTLGRMVPVIIGFMASLLGLGGISGKIKKIIEAVQKPVNKVIDWVVGKAIAFGKKAIALGKRALAKVKAKGKEAWGKLKKKIGIKEKTPEQVEAEKKQRLDKGVAAAVKAVNRFKGKPFVDRLVPTVLSAIRVRYRMASLELVERGKVWAVHGKVNPETTEDSALPSNGAADHEPNLNVGDMVNVYWGVPLPAQLESKDPTKKVLMFRITVGQKLGRGFGYAHFNTEYAKTPPKVVGPYDPSKLLVPTIKPGVQGMTPVGPKFDKAVIALAIAENPTRTCVFCGRIGVASQVDHAWPRAKGGDGSLANAQLACQPCNGSKGESFRPKTAPIGYGGPWPPHWW